MKKSRSWTRNQELYHRQPKFTPSKQMPMDTEVVADSDGVPLQLQFPWPLVPGDIDPADIENYRIPCKPNTEKDGK
jgi:hypothetical protein